jgi:hypothetical protein
VHKTAILQTTSLIEQLRELNMNHIRSLTGVGLGVQCLNDGFTPVMGDLLRKHPNLVEFMERVRTTFYPELAEA